MTNTIKEFVESQNGNGFNEKFENMVLMCMEKLPAIEKEIAEKGKYLKELSIKIANNNANINDIDRTKWSIEEVISRAKRIANDSV